MGAAPIGAWIWFSAAREQINYVALEFGSLVLLAIVVGVGWYGWRPLFRVAERAFWSLNSLIVQPIYSLLITVGAAILMILGWLPFFTLGEDTVMYKSVALDVILLFVLVSTLFATSRTIYDEIEDRTMLTLMSKPVRRWEVLLGKYLGIILSAAVAAFGAFHGLLYLDRERVEVRVDVVPFIAEAARVEGLDPFPHFRQFEQ